MAPVEVEHLPRDLPLTLAILRVATAAYVSYTVGRSLYRSHQALRPAQDTRYRQSERAKLSIAFGGFAALGLAFAISSGLKYLTLSYKVWASERGVDYPESLFESRTLTALGTSRSGLYLRYWLTDTSVYLDALEIIAEKTRRLWWGQQLDLATISWTALLAIEGRRRRIPHLWAYALLPHLVNLSFAQNLFYVALLQTPSPIPPEETRIARALHKIFPRKANNWFPKPSLLIVPLILNYLATLWLPWTAGTSSFPTAVFLTRLLTLAPVMLPNIVPTSWGIVYSDPRDAYPSITKLFRTISAMTGLLHVKTTLSALLYNLPGSYKHRHSIKIPLDIEKRSKWERTATAIEKVLGSMTDHPVVSAAGKDVLLSALTLGIWAAVRSADVGNMLRVAIPFPKSLQRSSSEEAPTETVKAEEASTASAHEESPKPATTGMTLRRRGRPKKTSISSIASSDMPAEETQPTPRRRGRPRKAKPEPEPEPEPEQDGLEPEDVPNDKTYEPTPKVRAEVEMGDIMPQEDFDWEPASLAWGLTVLGGLGAASAAVYGAECVSR
ncbi:hypothetical protein VTI74DRAFT_2433 [Chaetomium olivicolor]